MIKSAGAVADPITEDEVDPRQKSKPKKQPRYNVVLWDDPNHTFDYVIRMMQELFRHELGQARKMADEVDTAGRVICLTTTLEHAELKRDQIRAYGRDPMASHSKGSMFATVEPVA
ncbi:MAG TPA: Clp protease ClpS [Planctomycetaceae bacterium]|nr:Clp protease ClpS [Planctomycetaceae bacterium]